MTDKEQFRKDASQYLLSIAINELTVEEVAEVIKEEIPESVMEELIKHLQK